MHLACGEVIHTCRMSSSFQWVHKTKELHSMETVLCSYVLGSFMVHWEAITIPLIVSLLSSSPLASWQVCVFQIEFKTPTVSLIYLCSPRLFPWDSWWPVSLLQIIFLHSQYSKPTTLRSNCLVLQSSPLLWWHWPPLCSWNCCRYCNNCFRWWVWYACA